MALASIFRTCCLDWSRPEDILCVRRNEINRSKASEKGAMMTGLRAQLYFPLLHGVGISANIISWGVCAALLSRGHFALSPLLVASGVSSAISMNGCAAALSALEQGAYPDDSRKMTLLFLMYACLCLVPCPFFLLYPGVALPIRIGIPAIVGLSTLFEVWYPSVVNVTQAFAIESLRAAEAETTSSIEGSLSWAQLPVGAWTFIQRYFKHENDKAVMFALSCCAATCFSLGLDFVGNQWRGMFFDAIQQKNRNKFVSLLRDFGFIALASVVGSSYGGYITSMWELHWRQYLTSDVLSAWFRRHAYFKLSHDMVDNCDQRICEDVRGFVSLSRGLGIGFLASVGRLVLFLPQLMVSAPPGIWELCLLLSVASSVVTHGIGQSLIPRNMAIQSTEANFRRSLIQVREQAESIALMGAEGWENASCLRRFEELKAALWSAMQVTFRLGAFTSGYSMGQSVFPFVLLSPFYFSGQISMGTMFLLEGIMANVQQGLDFFIVSYGELAQWRATTDRLLHLDNATKSICDVDLPSATSYLDVKIPELCVGGKVLLSNVHIVIQEGDRVLISGQEGKSALLRALALIYPCKAIWEARPPSKDILFVPQRALIPNEPMTLRELLAFPDEEDLLGVERALSTVGLASWVANLDSVSRWHALSTAESQRLVFARLLCRRLPKWIFLDEPLSHISGVEAMSMFEALQHRLGEHTIVTITRKPNPIHRFHRRFFEVVNETLIERCSDAGSHKGDESPRRSAKSSSHTRQTL